MRSPDTSPNRVKPKTSSSTETISSIQPTSIQLSLSRAKADPSIAWARLLSSSTMSQNSGLYFPTATPKGSTRTLLGPICIQGHPIPQTPPTVNILRHTQV